MELPLETKQLLKQYLVRVRQDPEHQLKRSARYILYRFFAPESLASPPYIESRDDFVFEKSNHEDNFNKTNKGDYVISWLGILTGKFALAEWDLVTNLDEGEKYYLNDVKKILRISQKALIKKRDFEKINDSLYKFYPFEIQSSDEITKNLSSLHDAAIIALEVILYGSEEFEVAESALEAYTVIDLNIEGEGNSEEPPIPLDYDLNKRLEFWEWWLTEAIPQAWELAHKTYLRNHSS